MGVGQEERSGEKGRGKKRGRAEAKGMEEGDEEKTMKAVGKEGFSFRGKGLEPAPLDSSVQSCDRTPDENNSPSLSVTGTPLYEA